MEPIPVGLVVGQLSSWPDSELTTTYRLLTSEITRRHRSGEYGSDPDDDAELEAEAHQFGLELVARNLI